VKLTSIRRARALLRTRGDAQVIASGYAFATLRCARSETGWRHEMADRPKPLQLFRESLVKFDGRVEEKVTIRELHDCHSRSEGERHVTPATVKYSNGPSTMPMFGATGLYILIGSQRDAPIVRLPHPQYLFAT
jgi:hypothetical protein